MNTCQLKLDLNKGPTYSIGPAYSGITIRQGDKNGTTIEAELYDHGERLAETGLGAYFVMPLPDHEHYYRKAATYSAGTATVTIDETQAASVPGVVSNAYFELTQGATVIASTQSFRVSILADALADKEVPAAYDSAIQDAIDALDAAVEQMPDMVEDVLADHPEWTTTVQDGAISRAKLATDLTNPLDRLLYRLDNLLTATPAEAEAVTVADAAQTPMAGLALYGRSTQDGTPTPDAPVAIQSVTPQLLDPVGISASSRGLTATYEGQGWFRVSGTATGSGAALLLLWGSTTQTQYMLPAGSYAFTYEAEDIPATIQFQCISTVGSNTNKPNILSRTGAFTMSCDGISRVCLLINGDLAADTVVDGRVRFSCYEGSTPHGWGNGAALAAHGRNLLSPLLVNGGANTAVERIDGGFRLHTTADVAYAGGATTATSGNVVSALMALGVLRMGQTYTLSADVTVAAGNCSIAFRRSGTNIIVASSAHITSGTGHVSVTYTVTEDVYLSFFVTAGTATAGDATFSSVQLELGGTEHAFQPYAETVTPIDLQGHELRSLPDGTRDELTVDERGHVTLLQRVGHGVFDGSSDEQWKPTNNSESWAIIAANIGAVAQSVLNLRCDKLVPNSSTLANMPVWNTKITDAWYCKTDGITTMADWRTWLASNPLTLDFPLATPVTHDLGYVDAVPLCGPDLTAQAVPTAPFALTYERDLNATLARLEAALATLA